MKLNRILIGFLLIGLFCNSALGQKAEYNPIEHSHGVSINSKLVDEVIEEADRVFRFR